MRRSADNKPQLQSKRHGAIKHHGSFTRRFKEGAAAAAATV